MGCINDGSQPLRNRDSDRNGKDDGHASLDREGDSESHTHTSPDRDSNREGDDQSQPNRFACRQGNRQASPYRNRDSEDDGQASPDGYPGGDAGSPPPTMCITAGLDHGPRSPREPIHAPQSVAILPTVSTS